MIWHWSPTDPTLKVLAFPVLYPQHSVTFVIANVIHRASRRRHFHSRLSLQSCSLFLSFPTSEPLCALTGYIILLVYTLVDGRFPLVWMSLTSIAEALCARCDQYLVMWYSPAHGLVHCSRHSSIYCDGLRLITSTVP